MKYLTILKINSKYRVDALSTMFCCSESKENDYLVKGVLKVKNPKGQLREDEEIVVIENPNNLSKKDFLKLFNIADSENIQMIVIPDYILECGELIPFNDYKNNYKEQVKIKSKQAMIKSKARKDIENNKKLTEKQINELCEIYHCSKDDSIDILSYLEYCLFYKTNGKLNDCFSQISNIRYRDFDEKEIKIKEKDSTNLNRRIGISKDIAKKYYCR
jgi:hypothetical protein